MRNKKGINVNIPETMATTFLFVLFASLIVDQKIYVICSIYNFRYLTDSPHV